MAHRTSHVARRTCMISSMSLTRRHFLATSTAALAAGTLGRVEFFAQVAPAQGAQPPAPVTPVFKELRRNTGYWTARGGTIGWLINPVGRRRGRQPVPRHGGALSRAAAEDFRQGGHRHAHQLASSRRPHRRQRRVPSEDEADHRPRERAEIHEVDVRPGGGAPRAAEPAADDAAADRASRPRQDIDRRAGVRSRATSASR